MNEQTNFNWRRLLITSLLVLVSAGLAGGEVYYFFSRKLNDEQNTTKRLSDELDSLKKESETTKAVAEEKGEVEDQLVVKVQAIADKYMDTRVGNNGNAGVAYLEPSYITKLGVTQADANSLFNAGASGVITITSHTFVSAVKVGINQYKFSYKITSSHQGTSWDGTEDVYLELVKGEWKIYKDSIWDSIEKAFNK